jgi:hypothetical protein
VVDVTIDGRRCNLTVEEVTVDVRGKSDGGGGCKGGFWVCNTWWLRMYLLAVEDITVGQGGKSVNGGRCNSWRQRME